MADRYEETTVETTYVGFTFAGGETEAASTKVWTPHSDVPQGIAVNVVPNGPTPFLIGLDVTGENGLVIDCHSGLQPHHETLLFVARLSRQHTMRWR